MSISVNALRLKPQVTINGFVEEVLGLQETIRERNAERVLSDAIDYMDKRAIEVSRGVYTESDDIYASISRVSTSESHRYVVEDPTFYFLEHEEGFVVVAVKGIKSGLMGILLSMQSVDSDYSIYTGTDEQVSEGGLTWDEFHERSKWWMDAPTLTNLPKFSFQLWAPTMMHFANLFSGDEVPPCADMDKRRESCAKYIHQSDIVEGKVRDGSPMHEIFEAIHELGREMLQSDSWRAKLSEVPELEIVDSNTFRDRDY